MKKVFVIVFLISQKLEMLWPNHGIAFQNFNKTDNCDKVPLLFQSVSTMSVICYVILIQ